MSPGPRSGQAVLRHVRQALAHRFVVEAARFLQVADEGFFQRGVAAVLDERGGAVAGEHLAGVHQRDAVAALGFVHEVGGNEDGDLVAAREIDHQLPETVARYRIDAGGRLVENQQVRPVNHRHRQRQTLANAQRQGVGQGVHDRAEQETFRHLGDTGGNLGIGQMEQLRVQFQVLPHGQFGVQRERLRHVADTLARGQIAGVDGPGRTAAHRLRSVAAGR